VRVLPTGATTDIGPTADPIPARRSSGCRQGHQGHVHHKLPKRAGSITVISWRPPQVAERRAPDASSSTVGRSAPTICRLPTTASRDRSDRLVPRPPDEPHPPATTGGDAGNLPHPRQAASRQLNLPSGPATTYRCSCPIRSFTSTNQLKNPVKGRHPTKSAPSADRLHRPGDHTVGDHHPGDGRFAPHLNVAPTSSSLRLINWLAGSRRLRLRDVGWSPFVQIGTGALLPKPTVRPGHPARPGAAHPT